MSLNSNIIIPIVTATDENYAPYSSVMIGSLLEHIKSGTKIHLYIIDDDISTTSKDKLKKIVEESEKDATIEFITVNKEIYKDFLETHHSLDHISLATYFRISLTQFLNVEYYQKALYIDADMLILDDVSEIYKLDLNKKSIGAVIDLGEPFRLRRLGIDSTDYYFNAGFLFINLKLWNKKGITNKAIEFLKNNKDKIYYHDQDALNAVLHDDWFPIHPKWNVQSKWDPKTFLTFNSRPAPDKTYEKLYLESREDPSIIHPTGPDKPWDPSSTHPYKNEYLKRLEKWYH